MKRKFTGYIGLSGGDYYFTLDNQKSLDFYVPIFAEKLGNDNRVKCTVIFTTTKKNERKRKKLEKLIKGLDKNVSL